MSRICIWKTQGLEYSFTPREDYWTTTPCAITVEGVMLKTIFDHIHTLLCKLYLEEGKLDQKMFFDHLNSI